ncbi:MAG TPA: hypothetical protein PKC24_11955, partial [Cyclobacteriaceae bacterium]|nr:hypothetical protein [Cyclobacteriaceae bacterium]
IPEKLLSTRTAVFYEGNFTGREFNLIQAEFQRMGLDAVVYYHVELLFAGKDIESGLSEYLNSRDINQLVLIKKSEDNFHLAVAEYNRSRTWFNQSASAWYAHSANLIEVLRGLYRESWSQQKKQNFLVNDSPEFDLPFSSFRGRRSEFYAIDLRVDRLAVPLVLDSLSLAELMLKYPYKFALTEREWNTNKLRQEGYLYELGYIYARGNTARAMLGYEIKAGETGFVSVSFQNGQSQLKTFAADIPVYKFYVKHVVNGNVFLGTQWDADPDWQKALENHIEAIKTSLK